MKKQNLEDSDMSELNSLATEYHQKLSGGLDDSRLLSKIRKMSEVLVYCIPYQDFFLPKEECAEFYLYFKPLIDTVIRDYHIANGTIPYTNFLIQRIKFRARTFVQKRRKKEKRYRTLTESEELHEKEMTYSVNDIGNYIYEKRNRDVKKMNLKKEPELSDLIKKIVTSPHRTDSVYTPENKEKLHDYLASPLRREQFLLFLLTTMDSIDTVTQKHLADVFDVDEVYFAEISRWIHENGRNIMIKNKEVERATEGSIWTRYLCLGRCLKEEEHPLKRKELEFQRRCCIERLTKLRKRLGKHRIGLSYRELARETGLSLSKVAYTVKEQKKLFTMIETEK